MRTAADILQATHAPFPLTQWSVVVASAGQPGRETILPDARHALDQLCQDYWPPLYSFARRRGHSPHDAQDLVQEFFSRLLENRAHARADRQKGKFRTFLLAAFKNHLADAYDHRERIKRGRRQSFVWLETESAQFEALHARELTAHTAGDEERDFERRWAITVLARALGHLEARFSGDAARARIFAALKPFLTGGSDLPSQQETARSLGMSGETLRNHISRLRARFREVLREEVSRTLTPEDDSEEETRYLLRVLLATR